mgnify:CR=1 FL=1
MFFCISDLAAVDPMYQYSLTWFISLFNRAMDGATQASIIEKRVQNLNEYFTYSLYVNVCRSLFEKHKLMFSLMLCIKILQVFLISNILDKLILVFWSYGHFCLIKYVEVIYFLSSILYRFPGCEKTFKYSLSFDIVDNFFLVGNDTISLFDHICIFVTCKMLQNNAAVQMNMTV